MGIHELKGRPETGWDASGIHFQVTGLGRRVSGSGVQVRVQVPDLILAPEPAPAPVAET